MSLDIRDSFIEINENEIATITITKDKETVELLSLRVTPLTYGAYNDRRSIDSTLPMLNNITTSSIPANPAESKTNGYQCEVYNYTINRYGFQ